jgi:hypothetical protein
MTAEGRVGGLSPDSRGVFERDQWQLSNEAIAGEVKRQRPRFPLLAHVHEIWLAETHESGEVQLD